MKKLLTLCLCSSILICNGFTQDSVNSVYPTISYLKIKVDSFGNLPTNPYIIQKRHGRKSLTVIGTQHTRDTLSTVFTAIEKAFEEMQPGVVINEAGKLTHTYGSRNEAILKDGELGLEKFLADKAGIQTSNGDEPDKLEFDELSKIFSKDEALFYFASERFIFPYVFGQYSGTLEDEYDNNFIKGYLEKEGIELTAEEKTLGYYKTLYRRYFHQEFSLEKINQLDFTPFGTRNRFNSVTRKSKELRDVYLCKQIEAQLKLHDRVLVVFGGWHVLSVEPALELLVRQAR